MSTVNSLGHVGMVSYLSHTVPGQASQRLFTNTKHTFFAIKWHLHSLNQRMRKNGRRNIFINKSSQKKVPEARIDRGASCTPSSIATDRPLL